MNTKKDPWKTAATFAHWPVAIPGMLLMMRRPVLSLAVMTISGLACLVYLYAMVLQMVPSMRWGWIENWLNDEGSDDPPYWKYLTFVNLLFVLFVTSAAAYLIFP